MLMDVEAGPGRLGRLVVCGKENAVCRGSAVGFARGRDEQMHYQACVLGRHLWWQFIGWIELGRGVD